MLISQPLATRARGKSRQRPSGGPRDRNCICEVRCTPWPALLNRLAQKRRVLIARLSSICGQRSIAFDEAALRAITVAAKGSFGEALTILGRVERHGDATIDSVKREPEFGWGPTMLTCWRAVLGGRLDEAMSLFGAIGRDDNARMAAVQAFLVECHARALNGNSSAGTGMTPALDLLPAESWPSILQDWADWSRERGILLNEAMDRALGFWGSVRVGQPWRAGFRKGFEALSGNGQSRQTPRQPHFVDLES